MSARAPLNCARYQPFPACFSQPAHHHHQALGSHPLAEANANGAGDTFCAGFLAAMLRGETNGARPLTLSETTKCASLAALHRVDGGLREVVPPCSMEAIVGMVVGGAADELDVVG